MFARVPPQYGTVTGGETVPIHVGIEAALPLGHDYEYDPAEVEWTLRHDDFTVMDGGVDGPNAITAETAQKTIGGHTFIDTADGRERVRGVLCTVYVDLPTEEELQSRLEESAELTVNKMVGVRPRKRVKAELRHRGRRTNRHRLRRPKEFVVSWSYNPPTEEFVIDLGRYVPESAEYPDGIHRPAPRPEE